MRKTLLTTEAAAELAGVAASSIKRWADGGLIASVRTAGGHRRIDRPSLERFLRERSHPVGEADGRSPWVTRLLRGDRDDVAAALFESKSRLGSWHAVADEVGYALVELGGEWERGEISISDEHRASDALERALRLVGDAHPVFRDARRVLLATPDGDDHTLGLSLAELVLREAGYRTIWLGRRTPAGEIVRLVRDGSVDAVALSASVASGDSERLGRLVRPIALACQERNVTLILGGGGAWPSELGVARRVRSFGELALSIGEGN